MGSCSIMGVCRRNPAARRNKERARRRLVEAFLFYPSCHLTPVDAAAESCCSDMKQHKWHDAMHRAPGLLLGTSIGISTVGAEPWPSLGCEHYPQSTLRWRMAVSPQSSSLWLQPHSEFCSPVPLPGTEWPTSNLAEIHGFGSLLPPICPSLFSLLSVYELGEY